MRFAGPQEAEERFHFILKNVSGGGALDESSSSVLIVIKKKGYPNGLFYMSGVIEPSSIIDEPTNINETTLKIHVNRQFGRVGGVNVKHIYFCDKMINHVFPIELKELIPFAE